MLDMLIQIPGPTFLEYFIYLSIGCIIIGNILISFDGSNHYPMPSPTALSPVALAALRGGRNAAIQTALFSLWQRGLITIDATSSRIKSVLNSPHFPKDKIEEAIYQIAQTEQLTRDLVTNSILLSQVDQHLKPIYQELERLHLKRDSEQLQRAKKIAKTIMYIIGGIGGLKLILGIVHDRPFGFLIVLLIIALVITYVILWPRNPATRLGQLYLKDVNKKLGWIKKILAKLDDNAKIVMYIIGGFYVINLFGFLIVLLIIALFITYVILWPRNPATRLGQRYLKDVNKKLGWTKEILAKQGDLRGIDPAYSIAIFGVSAIVGLAIFTVFNEAFAGKNDDNSWSGGCSGCGGGGDGGSGGCGGCGGGD